MKTNTPSRHLGGVVLCPGRGNNNSDIDEEMAKGVVLKLESYHYLCKYD